MIEELTEFTGNKASNIARAMQARYEKAIDAWEKEMEGISEEETSDDLKSKEGLLDLLYNDPTNLLEGYDPNADLGPYDDVETDYLWEYCKANNLDYDKEKARHRAESIVNYALCIGVVEYEDREEAIAVALNELTKLTSGQITTLDVKIGEIEEINIRAKDERRRNMDW